ncbi:metal ABC transporter substrate-binding protein [Dehalogenimonas sp. 4OHTPN]|uniref:Metal ABC transporter substrate-binding protein n=1 Tax=Dehalogenimonas sp. 4OHTPN TaxID=3166643 RepID=A0AAU8GAF1_9CHLR
MIVRTSLALLLAASLIFSTIGCRPDSEDKGIVVTYSILGSIVKDLVGGEALVTVLIPDGADPHQWEPSARDIERVNNATLVIRNGLGLEEGLESTLEAAENRGVRIFTAADHIEVRRVETGEGIPGGDPDQQTGAPDPHIWVDPLAMKRVVTALAVEIETVMGIETSGRARDLESRLDALHAEIAGIAITLPSANRKLVTGHESMGYFAQRYGFQLIGAVIPNLSSQAGVSAADLATLIKLVRQNQVKAIFTETGTSAVAAQQVAAATGAAVVELSPAKLQADGSYFSFMRKLAGDVVEALR